MLDVEGVVSFFEFLLTIHNTYNVQDAKACVYMGGRGEQNKKSRDYNVVARQVLS